MLKWLQGCNFRCNVYDPPRLSYVFDKTLESGVIQFMGKDCHANKMTRKVRSQAGHVEEHMWKLKISLKLSKPSTLPLKDSSSVCPSSRLSRHPGEMKEKEGPRVMIPGTHLTPSPY